MLMEADVIRPVRIGGQDSLVLAPGMWEDF